MELVSPLTLAVAVSTTPVSELTPLLAFEDKETSTVALVVGVTLRLTLVETLVVALVVALVLTLVLVAVTVVTTLLLLLLLLPLLLLELGVAVVVTVVVPEPEALVTVSVGMTVVENVEAVGVVTRRVVVVVGAVLDGHGGRSRVVLKPLVTTTVDTELWAAASVAAASETIARDGFILASGEDQLYGCLLYSPQPIDVESRSKARRARSSSQG